MSEVNQSKIAMFKAAIALTWADSQVSTAEREKLTTYINANTHLSDSQRKDLIQSMDQKVHVDAVWNDIKPEDKAHLLNIATEIFAADGVYCSDEKALYERIFHSHLSSLDVEKLKKEAVEWGETNRANIIKEEAEYIEALKKDSIPGISKIEILIYKIEKRLGY
jgi:tellurite resistance protein